MSASDDFLNSFSGPPPEELPADIPNFEKDFEIKRARAKQFDPYVDRATEKYGSGLPELNHLAKGVLMREWNPNQPYSDAGAAGPMQVMPGTFEDMGGDPSRILDPEENIDKGVKYLALQLSKYQDPRLAAAAYNAGPDNVDKYGDMPHNEKVQNYIKATNAYARRIRPTEEEALFDQGGENKPSDPSDAFLQSVSGQSTPEGLSKMFGPIVGQNAASQTSASTAPTPIPGIPGIGGEKLTPASTSADLPQGMSRGAEGVVLPWAPPQPQVANPAALSQFDIAHQATQGLGKQIPGPDVSAVPNLPAQQQMKAPAPGEPFMPEAQGKNFDPTAGEMVGQNIKDLVREGSAGFLMRQDKNNPEMPITSVGGMVGGLAPMAAALVNPFVGVAAMFFHSYIRDLNAQSDEGTKFLDLNHRRALAGAAINAAASLVPIKLKLNDPVAKGLFGATIGAGGGMANVAVDQLAQQGKVDFNDPQYAEQYSDALVSGGVSGFGIGALTPHGEHAEPPAEPEAQGMETPQLQPGAQNPEPQGTPTAQAPAQEASPNAAPDEIFNHAVAAGRTSGEAQALSRSMSDFLSAGGEVKPEPEENPAAPAEAPAPMAKQESVFPHEITRAEYYRILGDRAPDVPRAAFTEHRDLVDQALSSGKDVPENVLKDYRDLKAYRDMRDVMQKDVAPSEKINYTPAEAEAWEAAVDRADFQSRKNSSEEIRRPFAESDQASGALPPGDVPMDTPPSEERDITTGLPSNSKNSLPPAASTERGSSAEITSKKVSPPGVKGKGEEIQIRHVGQYAANALSQKNPKTGRLEIHLRDEDAKALKLYHGEASNPQEMTKGEMKKIMGRPVVIDENAPPLDRVAHHLNEDISQEGSKPVHHIGGEPSSDMGYNGDDIVAALLNRPHNPEDLRREIKEARANLTQSSQDEYLRHHGEGLQPGEAEPEPERPRAPQAEDNEEGPLAFNIDPSLIGKVKEQARTELENFPRPHVDQNVEKLIKDVYEGRVSARDGFEKIKGLVRDSQLIKRARKDIQMITPRERGAAWIEERLLRAKRLGEIEPEAADLGIWLIKKNPHLANDLGISLRTPKEGGTAGWYDPINKIVTLMKGARSENTVIHEILHHSVRMMPEPIRRGIGEAWFKDLERAMDKAGKDPAAFEALARIATAATGDEVMAKKVMEDFKSGKMPFEFYQYLNPDEYWAVNGARIMAERGKVGGWVGGAKQWLKEFVQKVKGIFGFKSDAPILKGLHNVLKGEGQILTRKMLTDDQDTFLNPDRIRTNQEDLFGNKGRVASQGLMKGKVPDKGLEGTPLGEAGQAEENAKAQEGQQKLFNIEKPAEEEEKPKLFGKPKPFLGAKEFAKEDLVPPFKGAVKGIRDAFVDLAKIVTPRVGVGEKDLNSVVSMRGAQEKVAFQADQSFREYEKSFDKMGMKKSIDFIDRMKTGRGQDTPQLQALADLMHKIYDGTYNVLKTYKPGLPYTENYFKLFWKKPPSMSEAELAERESATGAIKPTLEGTKGFTKRMIFPDMTTGIEQGGIPETTNPVTLFRMGLAEHMRFISAQRMWADLQAHGSVKFVENGRKAPKGFVQLDDKVAKVYFPTKDAEGNVGFKKVGEQYVEENVARILNNYLSPDFTRATSYGAGLLALKNFTTAVELSISPFHFMFESVDAMASKFGIGAMKIINEGDIKGGLKDMAKGIVPGLAPRQMAKLGGDIIRYIRSPREFAESLGGKKFLEQFPNAADLVDSMFKAGARLTNHNDYEATTEQVLRQNLQTGNYISAAFRVLPALNEMVMRPLFETYIPRLKAGLFFELASQQLRQHGEAIANGQMEQSKLLRDTWDQVEERFGEMNFDNLFWNRTFKSAMQFLFRSVTWKLGSVRGFGKALTGQASQFIEPLKIINDARASGIPMDVGKNLKAGKYSLDPRMSWIFGVMATTATLSTIVQTILTGKPPEEPLDFMFPKTGGTDANGNATRLSVPTYLRDAFSLERSPVRYAAGATAGFISHTIESLENRDFYGNFVYDPNDPAYKKVVEGLAHMMPQPFSVTQFKNMLEGQHKSPAEMALAFLGFNKAPREYIQTEFQRKLADAFELQVGIRPKTPAQQQMKVDRKEIFQKMRDGTITADEMGAALKSGAIKPKTIREQFKNSGLSPMQYMWKHLSKADKAELEPLASDAERKTLFLPPKVPSAAPRSLAGASP